MADAGTEVGITIKAHDRTAPGFAAASKGADALEKKFGGLGGAVKQMPEKFSKMSGAMIALGGSASEMGGKTAAAVGQLSNLAVMLASGGALGVGIAAATLAAKGFAEALDLIAEANEEALKSSDAWKRADAIAALDKIERDRAAQLKADQDTILLKIEQENAARKRNIAVLDAMAKKQKGIDAERKAAAAERAKKAEDDVQAEIDLDAALAEEKEAYDQELAESYESRKQHENDLRDFKMEMADSERAYDEEVMAEKEANAQAMAAAITDLSKATTAILIADSEEARDAATKAAISMALDKITAAAASGAASAAEGAIEEFPYPYNLIVAAAASAAVYGAIMAFRAKVLHAASGGLIRGGVPGQDSVPTMLTPGELVVRAPVVQKLERMAERSTGAGGGDSFHINLGLQALDPDAVSPVTLRRLAVKLGGEIETMRARGMVRSGR